MVRFVAGVLCVLVTVLHPALGQTPHLEPIHFAAGTVLTFHMQTRLRPETGNGADLLPNGTVLRVKLLDSIDSEKTRDGAEFRGVLASPVMSGHEVVLRPQSKAHLLLVILRSRAHPEGFRYELLVTGVSDQAKSLNLTASLNSSFADTPSASASDSNQAGSVETRDGDRQTSGTAN
jgi:hypothetical protein